jgi:hypothetical protein
MCRTLVTALVALTCTACTQDYPLPRPIACEAVLALRVGMTEDQVVRLVGKAVSGGDSQKTLPDGTTTDAYFYYGRSYWPEDGGTWDTFDVAYSHGRLVWASAYRVLSGVPLWVEGSGNPQLAMILTSDPSKPQDAPPSVGPAMGKVFDCGKQRPSQ